ncbi:putative NTE family protein YlbK [Alicyclobacillus cellulosilyticus]|uniref:NTE family protein YlbK n=1 Tax=Alicyclobacillus cellulosilyticus TaxID=1003997 RepID=A0A917KD83_9BACL|nr:patatin-like phospholipase family protein [Alicyclobacillus cellulosilyticus]GGJ08066.1 putative NTE family protein YlbK [Alicyclobacillus cellulosilyticus]
MAQIKVGLALGSGGARGFAHIGVLKAFEEHGVPVHAVSGSSMGSMVAAFYATGMKPKYMEQLACSLRPRYWMDLTVPRLGLIQGDRVYQMVALLTRGLRVDEADLPLAIVAAELLTRRRVVFRAGKIADAVRASISVPGVFVPFVREDGVYVDGGVVDPVPVEAVRQLGVDVVVAVDVGNQRTAPPETMLDVIMQSLDMMASRSWRGQAQAADVTITPALERIGPSHFHKAEAAVAAGYEAAVAALPAVWSCLERAARASS